MATPHLSPQIYGNFPRNTEGLFEALREAQQRHGYIPVEEMRQIAKAHKVHWKDVHAIASFYPHFHLKPLTRVNVRVCTDMVCHLRGADALKADLERRFGSDSKNVTIGECSCVGRCDATVAVQVNEHIYENVNSLYVADLVQRILQDQPLPPSYRENREGSPKCDPYSREVDRYACLKRLAQSKDFDGVLAALEAAGLRGMGGAGFPTAIKWEGARRAPGTEKYIICNADESEPGTIKDRYILQHLPHLVIEGMIIAAFVVGARQGYLYIRHEYEQQTRILEKEIGYCYRKDLLGKDILGSGMDFDLRLFVSPGGYICGEESALIEAIEGKRAEPRNRPPRMAAKGLWDKPTALNNVETFAFVSTILAHGSEWFKNQGRKGSPGLKFVGVTGHVKNPGPFEVPMGITYRELINGYAGGVAGGKEIFGFAPSGPSSGYLPASMLDLPLDWDALKKAGSMVGSGAVVVCSEEACMLDMAINAVRFFRNESCGKCVPCRIGSQKMVDMLTGWTQGSFRREDMTLLEELSHALRTTSICGLGQILPAPIVSVILYFPEEVEDHTLRQRCRAGVCFRTASA